MNTKRADFFGTRISVTNQQKQINDVDQLIKRDCANYVTYSNVHVVVTCKMDSLFRKAINNAMIASPDGMPLVKMSQFKNAMQMERCSGPDMIIKIIENGLDKGYKHYFYGSTEETLTLLQRELKEKYPNIQIVGATSPPFRVLTEAEDQDIVDEINVLNPDCIWVGLGAPKQEIWMHEHQHRITRGVMFGVGAAFDFHAGTLKRAPKWMQEHSLEWLYRLVKEPKRLWKRYFITNALFVWYIIRYGVKLMDHSVGQEQIPVEEQAITVH